MTRKCISGKPFPKRLAKNAFFHKTFSEEKKGLKLHQQPSALQGTRHEKLLLFYVLVFPRLFSCGKKGFADTIK